MQANDNRIAKNTIFLYIRMFLVLGISLYTTRILLIELGVEDFGIYNVVCGFVSMFTFMNTSMSNGIQRFYNFELGRNGEEAIQKVYITAIFIQFIMAGIILLLTETIGLWYLYHKMVIPLERFTAALWVFQFSVFSFVFLILQVPYSSAVMAYEKMNYYAFISIIDAFLKLGLVIILKYVNCDKLIFYGSFLFIINVFNFMCYYIYCKRNFRLIKFEFKYYKDFFKSMLSFSGWNMWGACAYMVKGQGVNLLLNMFFGPVVNAARGVSFQIMNAVQSFTTSIFTAFRPQLVQSYAIGDFKRTKNMMFTMSKFTYYLLYTIALPLMLEINYILKLWLGDNIPDYSVSFTVLVIISMLISNFNTPLSLLIHATGRMRTYQLVTSCVIMSILPISWLFLKMEFQPLTVYWIDLGIVIINQIVCLFVVKKVFPYSIREYCQKVIFPSFIVSIMVLIIPFILWMLLDESFKRFCIVCIVCIISSIIFIYYLGISKAEKIIVKNILNIIKEKL